MVRVRVRVSLSLRLIFFNCFYWVSSLTKTFSYLIFCFTLNLQLDYLTHFCIWHLDIIELRPFVLALSYSMSGYVSHTMWLCLVLKVILRVWCTACKQSFLALLTTWCSWLFLLPQHVSNGIDTVKRIVQERGIDGVHGPLIENFQCDKQFFTAVEVTAGNK